ncbi:MAG: methylmalonyl-CoA mutase family protein [Flammeovirgaceae bacterium]
MSDKNLFGEFPKLSKQKWIEKATTDLKGADFDEKLVWNTSEGFHVMPFYTVEDLEQLDYLKSYHNSTFNKEENHLDARNWQFRQVIQIEDDNSANKELLHALNQGADAVELDISAVQQATDFNKLLHEVLFPYCEISFRLQENHFSFFQRLEKYLEARGFTPEDLKGSIRVNQSSIQEHVSLIKGSKIYPNFRSVVVAHEAAHSIVDKIASLLANTVKLTDQFIEASIPADEVLSKLELVYSLSNNYFFEIAGLRALRMLICGIAEEYGVAISHPNLFHIHATCSITINEETQQHPEWNMLSNTTQAMSAIIGGCNSLSIPPHNEGIAKTDDFSKRIARNISNILREEAYFNKVADPAAGSYYIEHLTHQLAEKAWKSFQQQL